jgi:hypothetical protein
MIAVGNRLSALCQPLVEEDGHVLAVKLLVRLDLLSLSSEEARVEM